MITLKLTIKQKKFADEYIISGNATQSYKNAGYSYTTDTVAAANGLRLLENEKVKKYIQKRLHDLEDKAIAKQEEVLKYLTSVLRGEAASEVVVIEGQGEGMSEARRMLKRPDEKERLKAAELLGKRYALFTEKQEVDLAVPVIFEGEDAIPD